MKPLNILLVGVAVAAVLYWFLTKGKTSADSCVIPKPDKFPIWDDTAIPHGDLGAIADSYLTPAIGGTNQHNGSLVGGFFKAIDVYPSMTAARYYAEDLLEWASGRDGLPYWQVVSGEYVCLN